MKKIEEYVRSIPDFPEPGIIFQRYYHCILQDADGLQLAIRVYAGLPEGHRGRCDRRYRIERFYLWCADRLQSYTNHLYRFVRKVNCHVRQISQEYDLEYGTVRRLRCTKILSNRDRKLLSDR